MKYPKQKHSITAWPKATLNTKKKMLQLISTFSPNTLNGLPRQKPFFELLNSSTKIKAALKVH